MTVHGCKNRRICDESPFPFRGNKGTREHLGMGVEFTSPHPNPSPPLEGEGMI